MFVLNKKILVLLLVFIPLYFDAAVPAPVFKWRNGGFSLVQFNKGMYTSPALLDINQDGVKEIIWANFKVFAFDGITGTALWSFWAGNDCDGPDVYHGIGTDTNVAIADINGDGFGEIVTAHTNGLVCAYDRNGYFLPGFPLQPLGRTDPIGSLSVFDLDNDGYYEIIIGWGMANNLNICVIGHDGTIKAGWPQYVPNPNANALGIFGENIAVGDINHDGFGELVAPSDTGKTCAYTHNGSALSINPVFNSWMTGWPDVVNYENYEKEKFGWEPNGLFYMGTEQPATIADINADGSFEIVIVGVVYTNPDDWNFQPLYTKPFLYNLDRTRFNSGIYNWEGGLPQSGAPLSNDWNVIARKRTNPVVVDLDGDGKKEILSSSFDGKLHCYWLDRTEHGNWPYSVYDSAEGRIRFSSEPAVADLDGNGSLEVIFTSWPQYYSNVGGHLFILNSQGTLLHKVALPYGDNGSVGNLYYDGCLAAPTIGDVDSDGQPEIVLGTVYAGLVVYDLPGAVLGSAPWPTGRHDYARTGWTDYISNIVELDSLQLLSPNGGENWNSGAIHGILWTSTGTIANVHIDYSTNNGGDWTPVATGTANDGTYSWTVPAVISPNCLVRVRDAADSDPSDVSNRVFSISSAAAETISTPGQPTGVDSGLKNTSYSFASGGSASNSGHSLQYKFDWDDGSDSDWLDLGTTSASHSWSANGSYDIRAMARCADHPSVESLWSETHTLVIADTIGYFNSPANRLILPEVNWAEASGGGDWVSEVQITDVTGGSVVQVYYNSGTNRRGPFTLWNNGGGAAGSSASWGNVLQTIDALDAGVFSYYGTGGSLEMITQDGSHTIQAAIRSYNGNYSRTFPALADVDTNTAALGRTMMVPNMSMDTAFRPSLVLFNPSSDSVTAEVQIVGSNGGQVGPTINRTVAPYEMAGVAGLRDYTYSNADFWVTVTGGSGRLIVSGQSANNVSNDPAAHVAVQTGPGYVNSPADRLIFPEVNWASASGGGDWVAELHITDLSGGAVVQVYYNSGINRRGPFTLWTNSGGANRSMTFSNVLQTIDALDSGAFAYYGTGGALELITQDGSHVIQAALKGYNGNVTRTFPAFRDVEANTAALGRELLIPNLSMNTAYRPSVAVFNPSADGVTMEVRIIGSNGSQIGSTISLTLAGYEMAGVAGLRDYTYSNACVKITVTGGSGRVLASGQSAHNTSNDPAAHIAVQGQ